jgi:hypothetical protein
MIDPWNYEAICSPNGPFVLGSHEILPEINTETLVFYTETVEMNGFPKQIGIVDADDPLRETSTMTEVVDSIRIAQPRNLRFIGNIPPTIVNELEFDWLRELTYSNVYTITSINFRGNGARAIRRLVVDNCEFLHSMLLRSEINIVVAIACPRLQLIAMTESMSDELTSTVAVLACPRLTAVINAPRLVASHCFSLWNTNNMNADAITIEAACPLISLPLYRIEEPEFCDQLPPPDLGQFEVFAERSFAMFVLPEVPANLAMCNFSWKRTHGRDHRLLVAASRQQWDDQTTQRLSNLSHDEEIVRDIFRRAWTADLGQPDQPVQLFIYSDPDNALFDLVLRQSGVMLATTFTRAIIRNVAQLTFTELQPDALQAMNRSCEILQHALVNTEPVMAVTVHFIGNISSRDIMTVCNRCSISGELCVTISHNDLLRFLFFDFQRIPEIRIMHCPNLLYVRPGFYTTELTVQGCDELLCVNMPQQMEITNDFNLVAIECQQLVSVICRGRIYVENCTSLSRLPRPLSLDAAISVGPGCPHLVIPHLGRTADRIWFMPALSSGPTVERAVGRRMQPFFSDESKTQLLANFMLVGERTGPVIDTTRGRIRLAVPQPQNIFTLCPFQRICCFVGSPLQDARLARTLSRDPAFVAIASALRRRREASLYFLPPEIWALIAEFIGAAFVVNGPPVPDPIPWDEA